MNTKKTQAEYMEKARRKEKFTYDEFLEFFYLYGEIEFIYKGKKYGMTLGKEPSKDFITYHFFECDVPVHKPQIYNSIEEFSNKANVNGLFLQDIWKDVTNVHELM